MRGFDCLNSEKSIIRESTTLINSLNVVRIWVFPSIARGMDSPQEKIAVHLHGWFIVFPLALPQQWQIRIITSMVICMDIRRYPNFFPIEQWAEYNLWWFETISSSQLTLSKHYSPGDVGYPDSFPSQQGVVLLQLPAHSQFSPTPPHNFPKDHLPRLISTPRKNFQPGEFHLI